MVGIGVMVGEGRSDGGGGRSDGWEGGEESGSSNGRGCEVVSDPLVDEPVTLHASVYLLNCTSSGLSSPLPFAPSRLVDCPTICCYPDKWLREVCRHYSAE